MGAEGSAGAVLVEIVPNFSEGRRREVIEAILQSCRVPGVRMLTWQADPDHNRLDASLVGSPEAVRRSALSCAAKAKELIDMDRHHGNHPRMGAVDVIPFLPIRGISMEACVDPDPIAKPFRPSYASAHQPSSTDRLSAPFSTTFCPLVPHASASRCTATTRPPSYRSGGAWPTCGRANTRS